MLAVYHGLPGITARPVDYGCGETAAISEAFLASDCVNCMLACELQKPPHFKELKTQSGKKIKF
jgi:hypothetical protein